MQPYADLTFIYLPIFQGRIWQGWGELLGIGASALSTLLYFIVLHFGLADCEEFTKKYPATVHAVSTFFAQTVVPFLVRLIVVGFEGCIAYIERRRWGGTDGTGGAIPAQEGQRNESNRNGRDEMTQLLPSNQGTETKSKTKRFGGCVVQ